MGKAKICLLLDNRYINELLINCAYYLDNIINIFAISITRGTYRIIINDVDFRLYDIHKSPLTVVRHTYRYRQLPFLRYVLSPVPKVFIIFASISLLLTHRRLRHAR